MLSPLHVLWYLWRPKLCHSPLYLINPRHVLPGGRVPNSAGVFQKRPNLKFVDKVLGLCGADLQDPPERSNGSICLDDNSINYNVVVEPGVARKCHTKVFG